VIVAGISLRVVMKRRPIGVSLAWLALIYAIPFAGVGFYVLFGEIRLGRRRAERAKAMYRPYAIWIRQLARLFPQHCCEVGSKAQPLHDLIQGRLAMPMLSGNRMTLLSQPESILREIARDIRQSSQSCYLEYYIWHPGGDTDDVLVMKSRINGGTVDLAGGNDKLVLDGSSNTVTVNNVETIIGSSGSDNVTLGTVMTNGLVQLGYGSDTLTLANGSNKVEVSGVQTVYGGTGADVITSTGFGASITMYGGGGNDTLTGWKYGDRLYGGDGNDTLSGGEGFDRLYGEAGNDMMIGGTGGARMVGGAGVNTAVGGSGTDYFTFISAGSADRMNVTGMSNNDVIELDTNRSNDMTGNAFTLSQNLKYNVNITSVASASAFNTVNFGQAGFVYRQDTGGLYYDADGKFSSGAILIGTITGTNGSPWQFDIDNIQQV